MVFEVVLDAGIFICDTVQVQATLYGQAVQYDSSVSWALYIQAAWPINNHSG